MRSTQSDYVKNGLKIVAPKGTELNYKFILPAFVHEPISKLVHGRHYFHNLEELRDSYPNTTKMPKIGTILDPAYKLNEEPMKKDIQKRKRKPNKRYVSESNSESEIEAGE